VFVVRYPEGVEEEDESTPPYERRFMTVCVASFAEKSKAIVAVSDKAVTYGSTAPIQADTGIKKMLPVGNSGWHTLIAGNPSFATAVVEKTKTLMENARYAGCHLSADHMMLCMCDAYKQCREALTEAEILSPYFITKQLWAERPITLLPIRKTLHDTIQQKLERFNAKTSLLVFGFSSEVHPKPHLFSVVDPGIGKNHDVSGNHAVGIGALAAVGRLAFLDIDRDDDLDRVLYEVLDAKANAELVQGVGVAWDAWIALPNSRPVNVRQNIRDLIDRIFGFNISSPYQRPDIPVQNRPPKNWEKRLKAYAKEVMKRATPPSRKLKSRKSKSKR
jgi:hypothetical protein